MTIGTVERAFQLAQTGQYERCAEIAVQLRLEGYDSVTNHFLSDTLKKQLLHACRTS